MVLVTYGVLVGLGVGVD
jgi:hypothetical protein